MAKYTLLDSGYVLMDNNGVISTVPNDPLNVDWQNYLESLKLTEKIVVDEASPE
jgi:hypothetical protein